MNLFVAFAPITRMSNSVISFIAPFLPILEPIVEAQRFFELKGPDFDTFSKEVC